MDGVTQSSELCPPLDWKKALVADFYRCILWALIPDLAKLLEGGKGVGVTMGR